MSATKKTDYFDLIALFGRRHTAISDMKSASSLLLMVIFLACTADLAAAAVDSNSGATSHARHLAYSSRY